MEREQFTFYASFARSIQRIRKAADRALAYDTIVNYALFEKEPDFDKLPDSVCSIFDLVKPNLDASRRKAQGGKAGRKQEDTDKITERCEEDTGNKKKKEDKKENKKEGEKEIENKCFITSTPTPPPLGEVMNFFLDHINATPSPDACDMLRQYTETLSADVVIHAMKVALDEKKTGFSYIKAILSRYEREGLNTLEAVKASEQAREQGKPSKQFRPASEMVYGKVDMEALRKQVDRI